MVSRIKRVVKLMSIVTIMLIFQLPFTLAQAPGDANGDGQINSLDVTVSLNDILEIAPAPGNGDCNNDGEVNILDVTCVLNIILEITPPEPDVSCPCNYDLEFWTRDQWVFTPNGLFDECSISGAPPTFSLTGSTSVDTDFGCLALLTVSPNDASFSDPLPPQGTCLARIRCAPFGFSPIPHLYFQHISLLTDAEVDACVKDFSVYFMRHSRKSTKCYLPMQFRCRILDTGSVGFDSQRTFRPVLYRTTWSKLRPFRRNIPLDRRINIHLPSCTWCHRSASPGHPIMRSKGQL